MKSTFIAVGASTRGLARSIRRAGYEVVAVDQFVDRDTQQLATTSYAFSTWGILRDRVQQLVAQFHEDGVPVAVVGAGGIENCPELFQPSPNGMAIPWLTERRESITRLRDPAAWTERLRQARYPVADVTVGGVAVPQSDHGWIQKPLYSGGGIGVVEVSSGHTFDATRNWLQEHVHGDVFGATCLADDGGAQIVGVCRHLRSDGPSESPLWAGAVGPLAMATLPLEALYRAVSVLAAWAGIRGWFGIDFVIGARGTRFEGLPIVLEINPRYTASMELIDEGDALPLFEAHCACAESLPDSALATQRAALPLATRPTSGGQHSVFAKRILYNHGDEAITITPALSDWMWSRHCGVGQPIRDVPVAGYRAEAQAPICTVFAAGACEATALAAIELQSRETRKAIMHMAT